MAAIVVPCIIAMEEIDMNDDWLHQNATVEERPFTSQMPLLGPLIAWFRTQWNKVSTKWYVRPLLAQQNEFNRLIVHQIEQHDWWLTTQDREQTDLSHDVALLTTQLTQLNQKLKTIDAQLAQIEAQRIEK